MLTLKRLLLEDFGPYRGQQILDFPSDRGVYIVYGPNGRGKTTLHNAFRYALYGENLSRTRLRTADETANSESTKERGYAKFKTILEFDNDDVAYKLTRQFDASKQPAETMLLERAGIPMTQTQSTEVLTAMAPASVSQFFLFDGERLKQYEDLLDPDSRDGEALEDAIERVLGIPIVANALADMRTILRQAERQVAERYAANEATQRMGLSLKEAQDLRAAQVEAQATIEARVSASLARVTELESLLKAQEKSQRLLGNLDALRLQQVSLEAREKEAVADLADVTPGLWKAMLLLEAGKKEEAQQGEMEHAQADVWAAAAASRDLHHLEHEADCPTCARELDVDLRASIIARTEPLASDAHQMEAQASLEAARDRLSVIQSLRNNDALLIADRDRALRSIRLAIRSNIDDIADIDEQLSNIDEAELRSIASERDERTAQVARDREHLAETAEKLQTQDIVINDLLNKLAKASVKLDDGVELRKKVSAELTSLFATSIDAYRATLREAVQANASEVFRTLSAEPDYRELRITEKYGLEILDSEGEVVRGRSAGYEHLVALALITALQDSAAVRGPVIMDSPFGRLDPENTSNVVAALPRMARQVILLAFAGEFDREAALKALGSNLVSEFKLTRVTSKNTRIEKG